MGESGIRVLDEYDADSLDLRPPQRVPVEWHRFNGAARIPADQAVWAKADVVPGPERIADECVPIASGQRSLEQMARQRRELAVAFDQRCRVGVWPLPADVQSPIVRRQDLVDRGEGRQVRLP